MSENKPEQLFPTHQTEGLKVPKSTRRLHKVTQEAELNPDAYEANVIENIKKRHEYRTQAQIERKRYEEELKELVGENKDEQNRIEEMHETAANQDIEFARQMEISIIDGIRAKNQDVKLPDLHMVALYFFLQKDEASEKLGKELFNKERGMIQEIGDRKNEGEKISINPIYSQAYVTITEIKVLDEKGKDPTGKLLRLEREKIVAAQMVRLKSKPV